MFLIDGGRLVVSPKDLRTASSCEFALLTDLDATLGRAEQAVEPEDRFLERIAHLGDEHEQRELRRLLREHPGRVRQFDRPTGPTAEPYARAHAETIEALRSGAADVVYQGAFFDGGFHGLADFLVREEEGWTVVDTKLARQSTVAALLQIAAYAGQLRDADVPTSGVARLLLGSGVAEDVPLADILPVYAERRRRLDHVIAEHRGEDGAVQWGDERWMACGRCPVCEAAVDAARDVLMVAGVRMPTRRRLLDAGVATIDALAARTEPVEGVRADTLERLSAQAALQVKRETEPEGTVLHEVVSHGALATLPTPSRGDVFFDFEGDPMWAEPGSDDWGLEYLFGLVEVDGDDGVAHPRFRAFWAHDREEEKRALVDFIAYVEDRRRRYPDLHIYHYADYERTALLRLAARHGVCEEEVDQLLRDEVLVDLYATVRAGVRVSEKSYSIKKLEPLYMGDDLRDEDGVTKGDDSIVWYHEYCLATIAENRTQAEEKLEAIRAYNEYDCVSTLRLRDWLLEQVDRDRARIEQAEAGTVLEREPAEPDPVETALRDAVDGVKRHERTREQQAIALVGAAIRFHAREDKPFWWRHFERLGTPTGEWIGDDGVFVVADAEVVSPWQAPSARSRPRRRVRLTGTSLGPTPLAPGAAVSAVYTAPCPLGIEVGEQHLHGRSPATVSVLTAETDDDDREVVTIEELRPKDGEEHVATPTALVPGPTVRTTRIDQAISELGRRVLDGLPDLPTCAGLDLLLRRPPRLSSGAVLPAVGSGPDRYVDAVTAAALELDGSYLAVQGPPGTGKTHVGSHVIARLVRDHGWRVGVCSQSHKAIEHMLTACVRAGLGGGRVGKAAKETDSPTWIDLEASDALLDFARRQPGGYVIGGTAWDLCHDGRVSRGQLDLLVIDEAGQYSLAKTLAVAESARSLLLLGDPQQLPQVSTGHHSDPVDSSALGWLIGDEPTLPSELGYFLETTWRMHPALAAKVSTLSYAGRLASHVDRTAARHLEGVDPGLHVVEVTHRDNATSSVEEADAVVDLVRGLLGRTWRAPDDPESPRPLGQGDVLVVSPYNAQVNLLRRWLDATGMPDVAVGTVDKFQGQEAPVVILSMAASAHADVSRGMRVRLDRNRLTVAVSRGQWCAYIVRSDVLTDFAPRSPDELIALGSFIGLCSES
jgi:predicted RecB family nuclease